MSKKLQRAAMVNMTEILFKIEQNEIKLEQLHKAKEMIQSLELSQIELKEKLTKLLKEAGLA